MLIVVSPAKRMNENEAQKPTGTTPDFLEERDALLKAARKLKPAALEKLMKISPALAALNVERYGVIGSGAGEKRAIDLYAGDTYAGLEATTMDDAALDFAQAHLRILSGLYGLLRPCDLIEPHRLEMGTRLKVGRKKSLYEFWGDKIALKLNDAAQEIGTNTLINCASVEYFTAADRKALSLRVITPVFFETRKSETKIISFFAKKARGAMARFICEGRITDPKQLCEFEAGGYEFQPDQSTEERPVFLRPESAT
ncbi:MAG: peroxide stress protein YaaA [Maritimibacter sp.]